MISPATVSPAILAEKIALAAGLSKSMSAPAVVPARSTVVPGPLVFGSLTVALPSTVTSRWTLLAALVDSSAAVRIALESVSVGPGGVPLHAPTGMAMAAKKPRAANDRRIMWLLDGG